jgi:hypothetical protein
MLQRICFQSKFLSALNDPSSETGPGFLCTHNSMQVVDFRAHNRISDKFFVHITVPIIGKHEKSTASSKFDFKMGPLGQLSENAVLEILRVSKKNNNNNNLLCSNTFFHT